MTTLDLAILLGIIKNSNIIKIILKKTKGGGGCRKITT
jgi:hypothetical protein